MKLDRNITTPKRGKYALIKLRETSLSPSVIALANSEKKMVVLDPKVIDFGDTEDSDFFVIRLKDRYAVEALLAYALAAEKDDPEYATEIRELAWAADRHPNKKKPD